MNIEEITKFVESRELGGDEHVRIDFKKRDPIYGLFIKTRDYDELRSKNFWRIVTKQHFAEWKKTKNSNLAKIFHGSDFTKLKVV